MKQRKKSKVLTMKINALLKSFDLIGMELESRQSSNDPNCDERVLNLEFGYQQLIMKDNE